MSPISRARHRLTCCIRRARAARGRGSVVLATLLLAAPAARADVLPPPEPIAVAADGAIQSVATNGARTDRQFVVGASTVAGQPREGGAALDAATGALTSWTAPGPLSGLAMSPDGQWLYSTLQPYDDDIAPTGVALSTYDAALLGFTADGRTFSRDGRHVLGNEWLNRRFVRGSALLDETGTVVPWAGEPDPAESSEAEDSALDKAGTAYVARYAWAGSQRRTYVTATRADGTPAWRLNLDGYASLTLSPDEQTVYLVGSFTSVGGAPRPGVAAVRASDAALDPWVPEASGGAISGIEATTDALYLNGTFTAIDGVARRGVAAVDPVSKDVLAFDARANGAVSLVRATADVIYLAGPFTQAGGGAARDVAGVSRSGQLVWAPALGATVRDIAPLPGGRAVVIASDQQQRPLTAWDAASGERLPWSPLDGECRPGCVASKLLVDAAAGRLHVLGEQLPAYRDQVSYLRFRFEEPAAAPVNTSAPRIVGASQSNTWVECDPGHWTGRPDDYRFAWLVDGGVEPGLDGRRFLLTDGDLGKDVACEVRAGTSVAARSAPVTVTPGAATSPAPRRDPLPPFGPTPAATASPTPAATVTAHDAPPGGSGPTQMQPAATLPDRRAPRVTLVRTKSAVRLTLSERATVTARLGTRRAVVITLAAGRHTLGARWLTGKARLPRGRHTLTVTARDPAGNVTRRVLRFRVRSQQ